MVVKLIFRPKPTSGANFIKIGVGRRTGVLRSLTDGLLKYVNTDTGITLDGRGREWRVIQIIMVNEPISV